MVTFVVNDGLLDSPIRTSVVAVLPPLTIDLDGSVAGTGFAVGFVEDVSGPVSIADTDVTIIAPNNLVRATITLANPLDGPLEGLTVNVPGLPVGITLDGASTATNVILTSPGASAAEFQTALRQVTYNNNSNDPNSANRLVNVVLEDDTAATSNTAVVTISVTPSNDGPVAQDDSLSVDENTAASGNVTADNGNGPDTDADDPLNVTQVNGAGFTGGTPFALPSGALLTINSGGSFDYNPNGQFENLAVGETASDTFTYTIDDGRGQPNSTDTATVTVTINGVNDAPTVANDGVTTNENSLLLGGSVLADNGFGADFDPDTSDTLSVTMINGSTFTAGTPFALALGALLTMNADGSFDYDPNGQFDYLAVGEVASDTFTYTVDDGRGQPNSTNTATVTITINGLNDQPVAADDAVTADEDTALIGASVLADNGSGADSDPDTSDTLTVTQINGTGFTAGTPFALASGALLTMNADGTFDYDPNGQFESLNAGQTASDSFSYTLDDGRAQPNSTDTATVLITINGQDESTAQLDPYYEFAGVKTFSDLQAEIAAVPDGGTVDLGGYLYEPNDLTVEANPFVRVLAAARSPMVDLPIPKQSLGPI